MIRTYIVVNFLEAFKMLHSIGGDVLIILFKKPIPHQLDKLFTNDMAILLILVTKILKKSFLDCLDSGQ